MDPPTRAAATRGVEQRLAATVDAYPGLDVEPVPAQFVRIPDTAGVVASSPRGRRVLRGMRLPAYAADEVYSLFADLWRQAGCEVRDVSGADGRLLVVYDPDGYLLTLAQLEERDPMLTVASPPLAPAVVDRGLLAGLAGGLVAGCLGPCVSAVGPLAAFPSLAGLAAPFWGWVPLFLLIGVGSLLWPETRRFGAGLLISGATVGGAVAAVFGG